MNLVAARKIASDLKIAGRSKMNKDALISAITSAMDEQHAKAIRENDMIDMERHAAEMEAKYVAGVSDKITVCPHCGDTELVWVKGEPMCIMCYWQPESNAKSLSGTPMSSGTREAYYYRQNGCERLTAKQRRRTGKKAARKLAKALA